MCFAKAVKEALIRPDSPWILGKKRSTQRLKNKQKTDIEKGAARRNFGV